MSSVRNPLSHSTRSFNSVLNSLSSYAAHSEVLNTFCSMLKSYASPYADTFPTLLKACASLQLLTLGQSIHQQAIVNGFSPDRYISSSLINFYSKFSLPEFARKVFDEIRDRDIVHWTAIIGCYSRVGDITMAFSLFDHMRLDGTKPSSVTLLGMVNGVSDIKQVQCLHGCSVSYGFLVDISVVNSLLNLYCRFGSLDGAIFLFEQMDRRDMISWNSLISGYAQIGNVKDSLGLISRMRDEGFVPDHQTFGAVITSCGMQSQLNKGRVLHGQTMRRGYDMNAQVTTSLLSMYLKCQDIATAFKVYKNMQNKDEICWTAMMTGLLQNVYAEKALMVFSDMLKSGLKPSSLSITSVFAACALLCSLKLGASVHGFILRLGVKLDTAALNSLISMYAKCGCVKQSLSVFRRMANRDLVSWNAICSGCAQNMDLRMALLLFTEMKGNFLQKPVSLTVVSMLKSCAYLGALREGKLIHNIVVRSSITPCILVDSALVDMYSKCGDLGSAVRCFEGISKKDITAWSTMISAYGFHGKAEHALRSYSEFLHSQMEPNYIIFLSVLSACNHSGLVQRGLSIFNSMSNEFGLQPKLEHLACVVDLLCRSGYVEEAYKFYNDHFSKPSVDVLGIILEACPANGKRELSRIISNDIINLEPSNPTNYVQLMRCFASVKRWDRVGEVLTQMKHRGLKKLPGWSNIKVNEKVTTFYKEHNSHPKCEEIVSVMSLLDDEMRRVRPTGLGRADKT